MKAVQSSMKGFAESNFVQQRLWSWRPVFTPHAFLIIDIIITIFFFIIGPITLVSNNNIKDASLRYDEVCKGVDICTVTLHVEEKIEGKINVFYKLTNFHQNHRRYVISRSEEQLAGKYIQYSDMENCKPLRGVTIENGNVIIDDNKENLLLPCGLPAFTFFNDSYSFEDTNLKFSEDAIAWPSDVENLFKPLSNEYHDGIKFLENNTDFPGGQTNQHFVVWMRSAALPTFVKLYAICDDCVMEKGDYKITIKNNYPTEGFKGEKWILVSRSSNIGTKNQFFAIACFVVGSVAIIACIIMVIIILASPRKRGDKELIAELIRKHGESQ